MEKRATIKRTYALYKDEAPLPESCNRLTHEGHNRRKAGWHRSTLCRILMGAGYEHLSCPRTAPCALFERVEIKRDREATSERAAELCAQELSLRQIDAQQLGEAFLTLRASQWHAAPGLELLRHVPLRSANVLPCSTSYAEYKRLP